MSAIQSFWEAWSPVAAVVGGFATGLAAAFGGGALWYARTQIKSNAGTAREQDAQQTYSDYLRLCIEYPDLSSSTLALRTLPSKSFASLYDQETTESERYLWFVSYMLAACEKIMLTCPQDDGWECCIRSQIFYHKATLKEIWPRVRGHYAEVFQIIVRSELEKPD